jgi:hypothetical protein
VSPLYFEGRHEDLAFEKPVGRSADRRQHVRLWLALDSGAQGHPVWLGSASFDSGVTLSRDTGQIMRKIAPNIDQERDELIRALDQARALSNVVQIKGIGPTVRGRNGEGDPYYTDDEIWVTTLVPQGERAAVPAKFEPSPRSHSAEGQDISWSRRRVALTRGPCSEAPVRTNSSVRWLHGTDTTGHRPTCDHIK